MDRVMERALDFLAGSLVTLLIVDIIGYGEFSLPIVIITVVLTVSSFVMRSKARIKRERSKG